MSRVLLLPAVGVILAVALAVVGSGNGPLDGGNDRTQIAFPVDPDVPFTWGYLNVRNTADRPAVLARVRLVGADEGIELVGARALRLREASAGGVANSRDFPPASLADDPLHPLEGFSVLPFPGDPSEDVWILLGLVATEPGVLDVEAIEVVYSVGRNEYVARYPHALRVCSPMAAHPTCPTDEELPPP